MTDFKREIRVIPGHDRRDEGVSEVTVERCPGRVIFVTGLLGHRAVVEEISKILVDPDALDLARAVAAIRDQDGPPADDLYDDAMNALAEHLASIAFMFHDWDLEPVAAVVNDPGHRGVAV